MATTTFDRKPIAFLRELILAVAFVPCAIWTGYIVWRDNLWLPEWSWWLVPLTVVVVGEGLQGLRLRRHWKVFVPLQKTAVRRSLSKLGSLCLQVAFSETLWSFFGALYFLGAWFALFYGASHGSEIDAWMLAHPVPAWLQVAACTFTAAYFLIMVVAFVVEIAKAPRDFFGVKPRKGG